MSKKVLSALSPSNITQLRFNVNNEIIKSFLLRRNIKFVSQFQKTKTFPFLNSETLDYLTQHKDQFLFQIPSASHDTCGIKTLWTEINLPKRPSDNIYMTLTHVLNNEDMVVYDIHKSSKSWWGHFVNHPLNISEKIQPKCCEIEYKVKVKTDVSDEKSYMIEKTWVEDIHGSRIVCNVRSLSACFNTFLHDSYCSVSEYEYLKINHKLAPVKTSIIIDTHSGDSEDQDKFERNLCHLLTKENISYELVHTNKMEDVFEDNDLRGVPFSVIISNPIKNFNQSSESAAVDSVVGIREGVVWIRDRNTHYIEPVNQKLIIQYLKLNLQL